MAETKKDVIVAALRERIKRGELERGTWVRQDSLADDFSTSITPVREALRELQAEGLLVGVARRGVRVAEVRLEDVKGTYMLRRLVEPYAMQRATMRVTPADVLAAERLVVQMEQVDRDDGVAITELNRAFHFLFYTRSGPPSFVAGITSLWNDFPWDLLRVAPERVPHSIEEHRRILHAVRHADLDAVAETTALHVTNGFRSLRQHLATADGAGDGERPDDAGDPFDILTE